MVKHRRLAVIPARGGSKRLPRKNLVDFAGKPMIAWSIEAAIGSSLFDHIIVSTEDDEIANTALAWGAEVPFRRQRQFDDHAPIAAATIHALEQTCSYLDEEFDTVVQLMTNCPLRDASDIISAVRAFEQNDRSFQISCSRFGWLNAWWAVRLTAGGYGEWLFPGTIDQRSQDLPPLYCPTGAIWIARAAALIASGTFYGPGHRFEPLPLFSAIDIDDEQDLAFARSAYAVKHGLVAF
jgi:N-acylneuraminate cytidylyltransferase